MIISITKKVISTHCLFSHQIFKRHLLCLKCSKKKNKKKQKSTKNLIFNRCKYLKIFLTNKKIMKMMISITKKVISTYCLFFHQIFKRHLLYPSNFKKVTPQHWVTLHLRNLQRILTSEKTLRLGLRNLLQKTSM